MKNRIIRDRFAALTVLSQRTLPSSTAINKVTQLLTSRFKPANEVIDRRIRESWADFPAADDADKLSIKVAEARSAAVEAILDESQPIKKIPEHMRLTAADMPKPLKGDDGWKNADELANIRVMLGSLYKLGSDEQLEDNEQGEELDTADATSAAAPSAGTDPHSTASFEA
jgi:hypothetical protein